MSLRRHSSLPFGAFSSSRLRRRIVVGVAVLGIAGGGAVALSIGNTAEPPLPVTSRPSIVARKRKPAKLSASDRRGITAVARVFVRTAVSRDHPERAWRLSTAALRTGTTLADWKAGTLPIPPYPVRAAHWNFAYSDAAEVGLDVLVESTDPEMRPLEHRMTLVRSTRTSGPTWLVDGWTAMSSVPGGFDALPSHRLDTDPTARATPSPGRIWVLLPFALVLVALLLPLKLMVSSRRAERRVRRMRQSAAPRD